jgi:hypothetical protein
MSNYSSIGQAVLRLLPKWLAPDVDETSSSASSSALSPLEPADETCPELEWPIPGQGSCGRLLFPPPPTPLELALARVGGPRIPAMIDGCRTPTRFAPIHPLKSKRR